MEKACSRLLQDIFTDYANEMIALHENWNFKMCIN